MTSRFVLSDRIYALTGSDTCTLCLAAPVAGARSVGPQLRTPGQVGDVSAVLVAGGRRILRARPSPLFRADQRLHREGVRLDAQRARGAPLLCHFSEKGGREEDWVWSGCQEPREKSRSAGSPQKSKESEMTVHAASGATVCPSWADGHRKGSPGTSCVIVSVVRESCADFWRVSTSGA